MEERRQEGHITYPGNKRMEEASRGQRRMVASSDGGPGPGPRSGSSEKDGWMETRE